MSDEKNAIERTIAALKRQRDELALKIHLGNMEAKEEYEQAKRKLAQLSEEYAPLKDAVGESAGNVLSALGMVGEEIKSSFERIRKSL